MDKIKELVHGVILYLRQSHRGAHLVVGILSGFFIDVFFAVGFAVGMESKEVQADRENTGRTWWKPWTLCWRKFDLVDFACTVGGGLVGWFVQWLIVGWLM